MYCHYILNSSCRCKSRYDSFHLANNKGADQTARMRRLVCAFVVRKPPKTGLFVSRPICYSSQTAYSVWPPSARQQDSIEMAFR